jgi:hypothetical protein
MCIVASVVDDLKKLDRLLSSREYILYGHFDLDDDTTAFPGNFGHQWPSDAASVESRKDGDLKFIIDNTRNQWLPLTVRHTALLTLSCGYTMWSVNSGCSNWATDWETLLSLIYLRIGETFAINASWIVYSCHAVYIVVCTTVTWCYPIILGVPSVVVVPWAPTLLPTCLNKCSGKLFVWINTMTCFLLVWLNVLTCYLLFIKL